jgi:hypothetical protein
MAKVRCGKLRGRFPYVRSSPVTHGQFCGIHREAAYCTEGERFGWSFVLRNHVPEPERLHLRKPL